MPVSDGGVINKTYTYCKWVLYLQPIEIRSLDASGEVHENFNDAYIVHQIITYDNNYAHQDTVTCEMEFTPYEENLFTLENNGNNFDCMYIHRGTSGCMMFHIGLF